MEPTALQQLTTAVTGHSWLALALFAIVYFRKILSPASQFPISVPPRWLPVVTAATGSVAGVLAALSAHESAGSAALVAGAGFITVGGADALLTAIFDHDNAPAWARAVVFVFDDMAGKGTGGGSATRLPGGPAFAAPALAVGPRSSPPAASRIRRGWRLLVTAVSVLALFGCLGKTTNQQIETGGANFGACVLATATEDFVTGEQPPAVAQDCADKCGCSLLSGSDQQACVAAVATILDALASHDAKMATLGDGAADGGGQ